MTDEYVRDHDPYMLSHELELPQFVYENLVQCREDIESDIFSYENMSIASFVDETGAPNDTMQYNCQNQNGSTNVRSDLNQEFCEDSSNMFSDRKRFQHVPTLKMNQPTDTSNNQKRKRMMNFDSQEMSAVNSGDFDVSMMSGSGSGCDAQSSSNTMSSQASKKFVNPSFNGSNYDDYEDNSNSASIVSERKRNHSQIEKRRRDKMNIYITELQSLVPMCRAIARKLDKLTVLRMAVQHLRTIKGTSTVTSAASASTTQPRPAFISEHNMNRLVLQAAENCFMFVVSCDRGRLLYASSTFTKALQFNENELIGQSVFDIIHPKDVTKVKEQLSCSDLGPRERFVDAKTMLPIKPDIVTDTNHLYPGARRSFFCRIKYKQHTEEQDIVKEEIGVFSELGNKSQSDNKYCIIHCTGYLKHWTSCENMDTNKDETGDNNPEDPDADNPYCLVTVGRAVGVTAPTSMTKIPTSIIDLSFSSRHAIDGKFIYVEQRVTVTIGFLPQEMIGTSLYEYVSEHEVSALAHSHKAALVCKEPMLTAPYSFKRKDGSKALLQTLFKPFKNPWTKDIESLICTHTVLNNSQEDENESQVIFNNYEKSVNNTINMQNLIYSHVESHKIGSAIAEEVLRETTSAPSPITTSTTQDMGMLNCQLSVMDTILEDETFSQIRNNVALSSARVESPNVENINFCSVDHDSIQTDASSLDIICSCDPDMISLENLI